MQLLKQNTAATVLVGPVLDSAGAAVTNAVIGDFQITKNGTSAAMASPATRTHSHNGFYLLSLATGDTDTVGRLVISVNNTAQSMSTHRYTVLLPSVFDALITNATNSTGGLPAATNTITALAGAVSTYAGGDTAGTTTLLTRLPSAISLSSGAVTVGTNNDKSGYSLTAGTGLGNQTANITGNLSGSVGSVTGAVGSVTARVTANTDQWGGVAVTGMPLPTASYTAPPSASTNASAVRTELATELARIDATVSSRSTLTAAGVRTELSVELARIDATVSSRLAAVSYVAPDNATIGTISTNLVTVNNNVLSRLAASSYVAPLSASETRLALGLASANLDTQLADIPTVAEFEARTLIASGYASSTHWTATRAGYLDGVLLADNYNIRVVSVTGSKHIASVVHSVEPAAIPENAFADNALSNRVLAANAAAEVATAVRTELAVELARIDVTSSSRLASSAYTAPDNAGITLIKTVTDRLNTGLVQDGAVWQFTVNMLENGPAGGGGGSATVGNQLLILDQLDAIQSKTDLISGASGITSLLAGAVLEPGQITSFPETLTIGDSYTEANGRAIQIPVVDTNGVPISSTGSLYFSSATVTFVIKRAGELDSDRIISGTATFVDPPGTGTGDEAPYVVVELSSSETLKGLVKYKYTGILTFTWPGTSDEVMSFETNTITFRE